MARVSVARALLEEEGVRARKARLRRDETCAISIQRTYQPAGMREGDAKRCLGVGAEEAWNLRRASTDIVSVGGCDV